MIGAPNFSLQLNRIYFNIFEGRRLLRPEYLPNKVEFFTVTSAKFRHDQIHFDTSLFPASEDFTEFLPDASDLSFDSTDRRIRVGSARGTINRVAAIGRRFAEWKCANRVIERELHGGEVLVMDGTLWIAFANESKYARAAYASAKKSGVVYSGLSKTSRLFTTTGLSLLGAIRRLALDTQVGPVWYYFPVADSLTPEHHDASIFFVRLNDQSQRVFRYEINAEQTKTLTSTELNEILSALSLNASDISFPGYPYGLIDADDNARVRLEELETYRVMLLSEISKLGSAAKFGRHMESTDAHDILNLLREVSYA